MNAEVECYEIINNAMKYVIDNDQPTFSIDDLYQCNKLLDHKSKHICCKFLQNTDILFEKIDEKFKVHIKVSLFKDF